MTKEEELINATKCMRIDGVGLNKRPVEDPTEVTHNGERMKQMGEDYNDFYARLRNMYAKPEASVTESKCSTESDAFSDIKKIRESLASDAKRFLKLMRKDRTKETNMSKSSSENIRYRWNEEDDVECKSAHYEQAPPEDNAEIPNNTKHKEYLEDFNDKFPTMEDLPKDQEELEKLFYRYVNRLDALADFFQRQNPDPEPGTEESVLSYQYKLDPSKSTTDLKEAVLGERKCTCPETVEINGDTADLKVIKQSVRELKSNHKVGAVVVSVSKKDQTVDDTVDTSTKLKEKRGPVLMTKYALEFLSSKIAKHPSLSSISFTNIPLSSAVQALLIPAFANLTTLNLINTKLKDDGIKTLCQYLWRSPSLRVVDFTDNDITKSGAEKIAKLIEKRGMFTTIDPVFTPLERMLLNKNPIGTHGMKIILKALKVDYFMKAIEMRECGIISSAKEINDIIIQNLDLEVLDLRGNNIQRLDLVIKNILENRTGDSTYRWENEEEILKYNVK